MTQLLGVFRSVPPVVRRRAQELLDVIGAELAARVESDPAEALVQEEEVQEEVQVMDSVSGEAGVGKVDVHDLWSNGEPRTPTPSLPRALLILPLFLQY
jgi:hypothetical protein